MPSTATSAHSAFFTSFSRGVHVPRKSPWPLSQEGDSHTPTRTALSPQAPGARPGCGEVGERSGSRLPRGQGGWRLMWTCPVPSTCISKTHMEELASHRPPPDWHAIDGCLQGLCLLTSPCLPLPCLLVLLCSDASAKCPSLEVCVCVCVCVCVWWVPAARLI